MVSDKDLLDRSLAGDTTAFGALVQRHESAVCAVSFAVTGDREVSEEVSQDAFLAAWSSLSTLREPSRFKAWACGIARNLARRARATRGRVVAATQEPADSAAGADEILDARSREAAVWASLELLSPTYRVPLVLFYREGRSTREVAEALGLSISTVEQRLSRGRKQLRAEVMDLVEQTLEDGPPRGRISSAVVAAIGLDAVPAGGEATTSNGPTPASNSTTMKTILLASTLTAFTGLTIYATSSGRRGATTSDDAEPRPAAATTLQESETSNRSASKVHHAKSRTLGVTAQPTHGPSAADAPSTPIKAPFELTRLGPNHVVVDVRGGKSKATGSSQDLPVIGHVEGVVLSADGRPIANAVVLGGRSLSMKFGTEIGSQAGVFSGQHGRFALPVHQATTIGLFAAHHQHGMSAASLTSTGSGDVELRLEPFAWIEGTVREGDAGIPAQVMLWGSKTPLLAFGGPTDDDGTYRLGPLPPGHYTTMTFTSPRDPGTITRFPEFGVRLRPNHALHRDMQAAEGQMLVLESTLPGDLDVASIQLGVFTGRRDIGSLEAFKALASASSRREYQGIQRAGVDSHGGDASFTGLEPGTYTGCLGVSVTGGVDRFACRTVELDKDELKVIDFGDG